jgi:peptidoglycan/LPS O-acetylase OafA/YrhL
MGKVSDMETAENGLRPVKRTKIQCLRGIAVLSVVLFHAAESIFPNGWIGVDLFFTISGYVVVSQLVEIKNRKIQIGKAKINGYASFLIRRMFRLARALAITITAFTFLMFMLTAPKTYQNFIQQAFLSLVGLGNYGAVSISGNYFFP